MPALLLATVLACSQTPAPPAQLAEPQPQPEAAEAPPEPVSRLATVDSSLTDGCRDQDEHRLCPGPGGYALRRGGQPLAQSVALLDSEGALLHELSCGDSEHRLFGKQARWRTLDGRPVALMLHCTHGSMTDRGFVPAGEAVLIRGLGEHAALVRDLDAGAARFPDKQAEEIVDAALGDL